MFSFHIIIHPCTPQKILLYYDTSLFSSVLYLSYLVSTCSPDHKCIEAHLSVLTFSNFAFIIEIDLHNCLGLVPSLHYHFSRCLVVVVSVAVRNKGLLLASFIINLISLLGYVFLYEFVQFILSF